MIIRGLTPGNMVGDHAPARRHNCEFIECPGCEGQMKKTAKLCHKCHIQQSGTLGSVSRERRERFDLALLAGWTLEDIFGYDPDEPYDPEKDKLPTMKEIMARLIKKWCSHVL